MSVRTSYAVDGLRVAKARQSLIGRNEKPMTQGELADAVGVHRVTMTKIENGDANVSLDLLERLSSVLGQSREHLLGEAESVDQVEAAKAQIADALGKVGDGLEELVDVVEELNERAASAGAKAVAV